MKDAIARRNKKTGQMTLIKDMSDEMLLETYDMLKHMGMADGLDVEMCRLRVEVEMLIRTRGWKW